MCVCGRGGVCVHGERVCIGGGGVCMHEEREGVHMEGVECVCMERGRVCIWKGWSVCA